MADKNFARSGTADTDLLADDDPLSELARLVNFEPRPVQGVDRSFAEGAQAAPRHENPVLALEDELLRAFEQYDAPASYLPVEPVVAEKAEPRHVEPVFEEPAPVVEDHASLIDEAPTRDVPAGDVYYSEPVEVAAQYVEPVFEEPAPVEDLATVIDEELMRDVSASDVYRHEPAFADEAVVVAPSIDPEPEAAVDPVLLLADELEASIDDTPSVEVEPAVHAGHAFADRFEPRFEEPVRQEVFAEPAAAEQQPAFLGLQPLTEGEASADDIGLDLERELELSIGAGFADELVAEASFIEPVPVAVEADVEPGFGEWMPAEGNLENAEPFHAEPAAYAGEEPQFVAAMPHEAPDERARGAAEAEAAWQFEASEPVFEAKPAYQVESVEKGRDYDHDQLLAEIESFPVPESRSPLVAATVAAAVSRSNTPANVAAIFGRATPTAHREPVVEPVEAVRAPIAETRKEPVTAAAAEPELDFENMEFDLSDIDLDLSDFSLDEGIARQEAKPVEAKAAVAQTVAETPVRREPAVAVPVSTYTKPQPAAFETNDGALPFDPAMIAETDVGVSPVTELDVPQLPAVEKEKPPVYQPDYDLDIDAEMAQLFGEPAAKPRAEDLHRSVAAGAAAASAAQPVTQINDVDDFERALEEDFRRSLSQPERMAIPVDPGQANVLYSGDGYDDEAARPRRGLMIAASIAGLLLIGGGGVYAWSSFTGGSAGSGEPRVILADKEPVKIVPEERGGKTVPNQDKAVYDRVAGDTANTPQQEQLVTSTEEPVDVVQRTLTPETLPFDGPEDGIETANAADDENRLLPGVDEPETAAAEAGAKPVVSPRKVKTMIVKPDGTLVAREDTVAEPATETAGLDAKATATTGGASANATVNADVSLRTEQTAEGQPRSALAEVADTEVEDAAPVRTVKTTTIGATSTGDNAPVPETRPIDQPVTVVGTVTENGNVSGTQTASAEQTQVAAVAPGSYVIQIASLPSEAEAQKSYNTLSSKFSSVIGGRGVDIKKAEIAGKGTYFRVRIPAGSREEANSLCNRYKSAGGSCLVTR